jgi:20S proteasome subunit alpha 7
LFVCGGPLLKVMCVSYSTAIGIKCNDGVVIAVGKAQASRMLVAGSNRTVFGIDAHAGMAVTGYAADGRQIVNRAREEAQSYRDTYGQRIVPSILNNRLSLFMHYFTIYGSLRPFGATAIMSAYDEGKQVLKFCCNCY